MQDELTHSEHNKGELPMRTTKLNHISLSVLLMMVCAAAFAGADDPKLSPSNTTVAILPVLNSSGEKDQSQKQKQTESGDAELRKEFTERGFKVLDRASVEKAIADLKIDFSDEEQQKRDNLYKVGRAASASIVVFVVVTDVHQTLHQNLLSASREGTAKLKTWVLDVTNEKPMINAVVKEGKSGGGYFAGLDKGSARIVIAVANGIRDTLKDFFKPYPVAKERGKL